MAEAEADYEMAFEAIPALPSFFRGPVAVAASVYRGIHKEIRKKRVQQSETPGLHIPSPEGPPRCPGPLEIRSGPPRKLDAVEPGQACRSSLRPRTEGGAWERHLDLPAPPTQAQVGHRPQTLGLLASGSLAKLGDSPSWGAQNPFRTGPTSSLRTGASNPGSRTFRDRIEGVRAMYFLSVDEGDGWIPPRTPSALQDQVPAESAEEAIIQGYRGAIEVVRAKHSRWPPNKLKYLKRGAAILDHLVGDTRRTWNSGTCGWQATASFPSS